MRRSGVYILLAELYLFICHWIVLKKTSLFVVTRKKASPLQSKDSSDRTMQIAHCPCSASRSSTCSYINRNEMFLPWMCPPEERMLRQCLQCFIALRALETQETAFRKHQVRFVHKQVLSHTDGWSSILDTMARSKSLKPSGAFFGSHAAHSRKV